MCDYEQGVALKEENLVMRELIKVQLPLKDHYKAYVRLEG